MQLSPGCAFDTPDIMPGRKAIRPQLARHGKQVGEFGPHIAADAGNRCAPGEIIIGELVHDVFAKPGFMVENIMGNAKPVGDRAGIADIITGAAGPFG